MLFTYVTGEQNALDTISEEFQIKPFLHCIGFLSAAQRNAIYDDSTGSYVYLYTMTYDNIYMTEKYYGGRSTTGGKLILVLEVSKF